MRGIRGNQIRNGAVSGEKIASGALDTGHISNNFILGPPNYATSSILDRHLYSGSIDGNKIRPQGIEGSRLANYAVTKDKLAGGAVFPNSINTKAGLIYNDYLPDFGSDYPYNNTYRGVNTESISIAFSSDKVTFAPYNSYTESIYLQKIFELSQNSGSKKIEMSGSVEISGSVLVNGSPIGSPDLSSYITSDQTSSFVTNSQTSSFITSYQTSSFITNSQTGSFGIPQIINVTYSELETLISASQLVSQQKYRITNYNSFAYLNSLGVYIYGMPEPLLIDAITTSSLSRIAISEKYPKDLIWYDINSSSFSDAVSPNENGTNLSGSSVQKTGGIFRRYDPERNIDLPFDWRSKMALVVSQSVVVSSTGSGGGFHVGYPSIATSSFAQFVANPADNKISLSISRHNDDYPANSSKYIDPFGTDCLFIRSANIESRHQYTLELANTNGIATPSIDEKSCNITYDFSSIIDSEGFFDEEGTGLYYPRAVEVPLHFLIRDSQHIQFKGKLGRTNLNIVYNSTFRDFYHIMLYNCKSIKIGSRNDYASPIIYGQYTFNSATNIEIFKTSYNSEIFLEYCKNIIVEASPKYLLLKKIANSKFMSDDSYGANNSIILSNTQLAGGYTYFNFANLETVPYSVYALRSISILGSIGHNEIYGYSYSSIDNDITVPWETDFYENYLYNIHQLAVSGTFYNNVVKIDSVNNPSYIKFTGSFYNNRIDANTFSLFHRTGNAAWSGLFTSNIFNRGGYEFGQVNAPWSQSNFNISKNIFENSSMFFNTHKVNIWNNKFYNTSIVNVSMSLVEESTFNNITFSYARLPLITNVTLTGRSDLNALVGSYQAVGSHFTASTILPNYNIQQKNISFDGTNYFISYLNNSGSFISTRSSTIP